jgi:uncharacterized Fe-S cluster-containing MiaB family protein
VRVYMMYKACPDMSTEEAIDDINQAAAYFSEIAKNRKISITLHISPTYVSEGSILEKLYNQGKYNPPSLHDIERLFRELEVYDDLEYYISLNDEGLSSYNLEDNFYEFVKVRDRIEKFNVCREK